MKSSNASMEKWVREPSVIPAALQVSLSQLARYLADHSNLSRSLATLYQQLKNYRSEYTTYSP